jgi:hypothetical protein
MIKTPKKQKTIPVVIVIPPITISLIRVRPPVASGYMTKNRARPARIISTEVVTIIRHKPTTLEERN